MWNRWEFIVNKLCCNSAFYMFLYLFLSLILHLIKSLFNLKIPKTAIRLESEIELFEIENSFSSKFWYNFLFVSIIDGPSWGWKIPQMTAVNLKANSLFFSFTCDIVEKKLLRRFSLICHLVRNETTFSEVVFYL